MRHGGMEYLFVSELLLLPTSLSHSHHTHAYIQHIPFNQKVKLPDTETYPQKMIPPRIVPLQKIGPERVYRVANVVNILLSVVPLTLERLARAGQGKEKRKGREGGTSAKHRIISTDPSTISIRIIVVRSRSCMRRDREGGIEPELKQEG